MRIIFISIGMLSVFLLLPLLSDTLINLSHNLFQAISFLRSPNQNRTVSVPKTYGFGSENVRFWDGNHKREIAATGLLTRRNGKFI